MIQYEAFTSLASADELAMRSYVVEEMSSLYTAMGRESPEFMEEVASSVTDVCRVDLEARPVPDRFVGLLMSHALWSSGDEAAAHAMLRRHQFERGNGEHVLASLFATRRPSLGFCLLMGMGVVRPSTSSLFSGKPLWILNVAGLLEGSTQGFELALFARLRQIIAHLSPVWEDTKGSGVLGVVVEGRGTPTSVPRALLTEINDFCRQTLSCCADDRGWRAVPEVQNRGLYTAG